MPGVLVLGRKGGGEAAAAPLFRTLRPLPPLSPRLVVFIAARLPAASRNGWRAPGGGLAGSPDIMAAGPARREELTPGGRHQCCGRGSAPDRPTVGRCHPQARGP